VQDPAAGIRGKWPVLVLAVASWIALLGWAFSSPAGSAPDEDFHVARAYCAAERFECLGLDDERVLPCFATHPEIPASCGSLASPDVLARSVDLDYYPRGYAVVAGWLVGDSVQGTVMRVRVLNATLMVVMALLSVRLSTARLRLPVAVTWLTVSAPLAMFSIASVSPTSWTLIGLSAVWGPLLSSVVDRVTAGRVALVVVSSLMVLTSRSEGPWLLLPVLVAVWVLGGGNPRVPRLGVLAGVIALAALVGVFTGGALWAKLAHDAGRGAWETAMLALASPGEALGAANYFTAPLGWLDTPVPPVVSFLTVAACSSAAFCGLAVMNGRKALALTVFWAIAMVIIVGGWVGAYPSAFQPRYGLPLVAVGIGMMVLPAMGVVSFSRVQAGALAVAFAVANCLALLANATRYTFGASFNSLIEPSPPYMGPAQLFGAGAQNWTLPLGLPPAWTWLIGASAYAVAVATAAVIYFQNTTEDTSDDVREMEYS
jgi:hypothetical protein